MSKIRAMELKYIIENVELEIEYTDLSEKEEKEKLAELKRSKEELNQLQKAV
ncbi:hypothetical protein QI290_12540 [Staphylococcus saprophyticus]|nr:hypothetical protein [Staphylococcus saprophyticus]MDW3920836.1 hypothetical protein [Staphylococcus saprophyticus]MDW3948344.1 hypothetical protein [Staphylococcus saprophyticus]MDW3953364.1 hypothetical protein [Staphylococcus saprophyticus]